MKFMITAGSHIQKDSDGVERTYDARGETGQGDIFESATDLVKRFGRTKFVRVSDYEPCTKGPGMEKNGGPSSIQAGGPSTTGTVGKPTPDLDRMSVKDLLAYAEAEEIDLHLPQGKAPPKDEVIKAIRSALQPA